MLQNKAYLQCNYRLLCCRTIRRCLIKIAETVLAAQEGDLSTFRQKDDPVELETKSQAELLNRSECLEDDTPENDDNLFGESGERYP